MERIKLDIQKFASVQSDSFEGRYLKLTVTEESTSIANNTSTVKWTLESIGGSSNYYTISNCYVSMTYAKNSADTTVTENVVWYGTVLWNEYRFPATTGSVSGTITVKHKNNGTALPVNFTLHGRVWYDGDDNRSGSINLTTISRYATSVQSLNKKTETTIKMNWSSDSTIDRVWYSTNNGSSWSSPITVNATSGNYTISGLSPYTTYNIKTRVRRKDSQLTTDSSALPVQTFNYPFLTNLPAFKIGDTPIVNLYNPLNRSCVIYLIGNYNDTTQRTIYTGTRTTNGNTTLYPDDNEQIEMYKSIPNSASGVYKAKLVCNELYRETTYTGNTYSIKGTEVPIFNDFTYEDTNITTLALTGDSSKIIQNYSTLTATVSVANKAEPDPNYYASSITKFFIFFCIRIITITCRFYKGYNINIIGNFK